MDALPWRSLLLLAVACGGQGTDLKSFVDPSDGGGAGDATNGAHTAYTNPFAGAPGYTKPKPGDTAHNAGRACSSGGCHESEGPPLLIGGTVYQDYAGTTPAVGVEIRIVDGNGNAASTYSDSAGNFYIKRGPAVALPAYVGVRDGVNQRPMITPLTGSMGSCAQASCHEAAGYGPIHIP